MTAPGEWYAGLAKPSFNPQLAVRPVWIVLYVLIAVAGWRAFERDRGGWPMKLWWAQLVLFPVVACLLCTHGIGLALVVILLLLAAIFAFIVMSLRRDRVAARLFALYAVWVGSRRC